MLLPPFDSRVHIIPHLVCPFAGDLLDGEASLLRAPEVLLEVLDDVLAFLALVLVRSHLQYMLGVQDVLVDTVDGAPPELAHGAFKRCVNAAPDGGKVLGANPGGKGACGTRKGALVRDEGVSPGEHPFLID